MPVSAQCQPLPLLVDSANMGDMVLDDVAIAGLYAECARRNAGWIEWSEKAKAATKKH